MIICHQGSTADPGAAGLMGSPGKQVRLKQVLTNFTFLEKVKTSERINETTSNMLSVSRASVASRERWDLSDPEQDQ